MSERGVPAYLSNVSERFHKANLDYHIKQKYLHRFLSLHRKFGMIQLILERITNYSFTPKEADTMPFYKFLLDIESYFYLIKSTLDIISRITPSFFDTWEGGDRTKRYFSYEYTFFVGSHPDKDIEYKNKLENIKDWYDEFSRHRNELAHNSALYMFYNSDYDKWYFGTKRDEFGVIYSQDIINYVLESHSKFVEFLSFYDGYFGDKEIKC